MTGNRTYFLICLAGALAGFAIGRWLLRPDVESAAAAYLKNAATAGSGYVSTSTTEPEEASNPEVFVRSRPKAEILESASDIARKVGTWPVARIASLIRSAVTREEREALWFAVFESIAKDDPNKACQLVHEAPLLAKYVGVEKTIASGGIEAFRLLIRDPELAGLAFGTLRAVPSGAIPAAADLVAETRPELLPKLLRGDPATDRSVIDRIQARISGDNLSPAGRRTLIAGALRADPDGSLAMELIKLLPDDVEKRIALANALPGLAGNRAASDPAREQELLQIARNEGSYRVAREVATALGHNRALHAGADASSLFRWFDTLSEPGERQAAISAALNLRTHLQSRDVVMELFQPDRAAVSPETLAYSLEWIADHISVSEPQKELLRRNRAVIPERLYERLGLSDSPGPQ